jgi:hypothetical protein
VTSTIFAKLNQAHNVDAAAARFHDYTESVIQMRCPAPELQRAVSAALEQFEPRGFAYADRGRNEDYTCLSLTYNPETSEDPHSATLGSVKVKQEDMRYGYVEQGGSYYDTYAFRRPTPAMQLIAPALPRFKRSLVRSRIGIVKGGRAATSEFAFGWHRDEPVFTNLRVNIPVVAPAGYAMQIETSGGLPVQGSRTLQTFRPQVGWAYSWDTLAAHRMFSERMVQIDRVHLVLGFSPWFDYDPTTDTWQKNEFFGVKHPFQMLRDGDVIQWN